MHGEPPPGAIQQRKGKDMMNETAKRKSATETISRAETGHDIVFLHRLRWRENKHPKLHTLLEEMHAADDAPTVPAPVIEIQFKDARYYIFPECIADFGLRLYSDYVQKRPPFTDEMMQKYYREALNTQETQDMLAALLHGGDDPEDIPDADHRPDAGEA